MKLKRLCHHDDVAVLGQSAELSLLGAFSHSTQNSVVKPLFKAHLRRGVGGGFFNLEKTMVSVLHKN